FVPHLLVLLVSVYMCLFFIFIVPATREVYSLSLHDALPILVFGVVRILTEDVGTGTVDQDQRQTRIHLCQLLRYLAQQALAILTDRKSTRLNSSHVKSSYAVFCLKKKKCSSNNAKSRQNLNF